MKFPGYVPFAEHLGLELLRFENGEADIASDTPEHLCNSWGVAHGGLMMTMLDVAMAHAAKSGRDAMVAAQGESAPGNMKSNGVATIEMKTSFMRPGSGRVVAKARVLTQTSSLSFCEAWMYDGAGQPCAHATGTFKVLRSIPAGGTRLVRPGASD